MRENCDGPCLALMVGMYMGIRLFQGIACRACDGFLHEHEEGCPQDKLTKFCQEAALHEYRCPKCIGRVAVNKGDFYECRKCRTQFSSGPACGEDVETLDIAFLMNDTDDYVKVAVMTSKGQGKFRNDEIIKALRQAVKRAVRRRQERV